VSADLLKEARRAAKRGDHSRAGDLYDLAGHPREAIEMYVQGRHYVLAGQVAARIGEHSAAAGYFASGNDFVQAAEMYLKAGQRKKASLMYERGGQYLKAADLEEKMGSLGAAAVFYEMGGQLEKSAYLYAQAGDCTKAAALYESLLTSAGHSDAATSGVFALEETRKRRARYARFSGILYYKAGKFEKAAPHLEEAGLYEQAVEAYRKSGRTERAAELLVRLENFAEALRIVEEDPASKIDGKLLGELLLRSGQFARAAETFLKENLAFKAAECFESSGDLQRAAELFSSEGEHIRSADLYAGIGRHRDAAQAYERGKEYVNAARAFQTAGMPADAARMFNLAGKPTAAAEIFLSRGEESDAIRILQQVKKEDPEHGKACFLLGSLFSKQGLHALAVEKLDAALKEATDETERARCLYHLGVAFEQMGRSEEARRAYEKVLSIDYHHADVVDRLKRLAQQIAADRPTPAEAKLALAKGQVPGAHSPPARTAARATPLPGTLMAPGNPAAPGSISTRLDFVKEIGHGTYAEVLEAYDRALQRRVAVKRYPPSTGQPDMYRRFLQEAMRATDLAHPGIVTVFGALEAAEGRYIIMELIDGRTLRETLKEKVRLEPAKILSYAQQMAEALSYAHRKGRLHRDIRPENLFLCADETIRLADFGLKARLADTIAQGGIAVCYAAPEQIRGERVDARSDIYTLGVVLYEMLLGETPFPAETAYFDHLNTPPSFPQKVDRVVPAFFRKIIGKCLEKDPSRRYRSAALVVDDLKASGIVPGVVVADRYEIVRELGIGGMGRVYQAVDRDLDETVAIKVLRGVDAEGKQAERFLREIKLTRRIAHPNVVKVFDMGSWREHKYITMEFIDGVNLEQWRRLQPSVDIHVATRMMIDIARGLETAHALGIIHRDIKPQNILLKDGHTPKILDFGIARGGGGEGDLTTTGFVMGSPKYMSPEQVQALPLDARTDVYSLGVVMYFVFTGREPFVGDTATGIAYRHLQESPRPPVELNADVPAWLGVAILRALEKDRDKRFASMAALADAMEAGLKAAV
jgi:serine/threonine protein kinase/Flp pilus assembly protein TadD